MKRGMMIAGLCAGMWLGGSAWGQETIVTNLLVNGTLRQDANSEASGDFSAALGFESVASGPFSHAEGEVTTASGVASHAEGGGTIAAGDNSHAEGQLTEALAGNSHAGGAYARVRAQDSNAFIHATGSTNAMKQTQYPNAAHFDRLVTLAPAVDAGNAVLSRTENDQRYLVTTNGTMGGELNMDENSIRNAAMVDGFGTHISLEERMTYETNLWANWNADLLDGYHAAAFVQKAGDTMTGDFSLAGSLILLPTTEAVLNPGFQTDGDVTMHWMTESGTYFKYGATGGEGDRFHFGSDGEFKAWGNVYSLADLVADRDLAVGGQGRVQYDPEIGTNQYALWVRNFGATYNDARGLLVTTPEYSGGAGIIFHAASKAGQSMASRLIVGTDGNVGVGVNDPQSKLHVAGDARVSGNILMLDGQNIISPNFNPNTWGSGFDAWGPNAYLKYGFVRELLVAQNSSFQGKVMIGTSSDYAVLNVGAPTNLVTPTYAARFESRLGADSDKARGLLVNFPNTTNPSSILFHAMSGAGPYTNSRFVVKADGKVGIGTSYPEATLHVNGDLRVDGAFAGDGSGLTNLPVTGLTTNEADSRYVNVSGDAMTGTLSVAGGITTEGITLTRSGAANLSITNEGDYPLLRNAHSEIWFGTPYDRSLWFNFAAGTNVYFGDVNNPQNICMYGDLHVSGTINGDGSGLINLPVTGLTTNEADARYATVAQGSLAETALQPGTAITVASVHILGNTNTAPGSVVAGGHNNLASTNSFVGGGEYNYGNADYSVVAGGYANMVYTPHSVILGGQYNRASGICSVVVGGQNNSILSNGYSQYSCIVGGQGNSIQRGGNSIIGGGYHNRMEYSGGGPGTASMFIGGGYTNFTGARFAVIPGGVANVVTGTYGFAAGSYAIAGHQSAFVWSDSSSTNRFTSTSSNQFLIRATGGVGINTNVTAGMALVVAGDVDVAGSGRFSAGIRVPLQGDISMGSYTNGTF